MSVRTRIAPSPTGRLHIGTVRTALFNYLYAKRHGGTFAIRVEDTDRARSTREYEEEILEGLAWLSLSHDEFVRQSERVGRHTELLQKLVTEGKAYVSEEESRNEPGKKVSVVRLKNPGSTVIFKDEVRGDISFETGELGDFVIARAIDDPLYHFAVVADDMDMQITHVIRGEDHISNTPRQILIQEALGAPRPHYAHLPLILAPDRSKLSKRHGATSLLEYRAEGFIPEAIINYLALLGWSPKSDREIFSLEELSEVFELSGIQKGGAVWNRDKLLSVNLQWLRELSDEDYIERGELEAPDATILKAAVPLLKERAHTFAEARELLASELACLFEAPIPALESLKKKEETAGTAATHLEALSEQIGALEDTSSSSVVKEALMPYAEAHGRSEVLWPLRYALSGQERSPDPFTLISLLGVHEAVSRIQTALAILGK